MRIFSYFFILIFLFFASCSGVGGTSSGQGGSLVIYINNTLPKMPSEFKAEITRDNNIKLTWKDNSENEDGFKIQVRLNKNDAFKDLATLKPNLNTYLDNSKYENYNELEFRLCSFNNAGKSDWVLSKVDTIKFLWQKEYNQIAIWDMIKTSDNSIVLAGSTTDEGAGHYDGCVVKLDINGNIIWQKTYGEDENDYIDGIAESIDGNLIWLGFTLGVQEGQGAWLSKINKLNGDKIFYKFYDLFDGACKRHIIPFNDGYILTGCTPNDEVTRFIGQIQRIDRDGNVIWVKDLGEDVVVYNILKSRDGNLIIAAGKRVLKLDEDGNILWQKEFNNLITYVIETTDNNLFLLGYRFDVDTQKSQAYWALLDDNQNIVWQNYYSEVKDNTNFRAAIESFNKTFFIVVGVKNKNYWIAKIDKLGNLLQEKLVPSKSFPIKIIKDKEDKYFIASGKITKFLIK